MTIVGNRRAKSPDETRTAQSTVASIENTTDSPAARLYTACGWRKLRELSPDVQVMGIERRG